MSSLRSQSSGTHTLHHHRHLHEDCIAHHKQLHTISKHNVTREQLIPIILALVKYKY